MSKCLKILLVLELMLLPVVASGNSVAPASVYRLLRQDGQVIAYTEFMPHVGDFYWQADEDIWYRVVQVEGDIGWVETTLPPDDMGVEEQRWPTVGFFLVLLLVVIGIGYYYRRLK